MANSFEEQFEEIMQLSDKIGRMLDGKPNITAYSALVYLLYNFVAYCHKAGVGDTGPMKEIKDCVQTLGKHMAGALVEKWGDECVSTQVEKMADKHGLDLKKGQTFDELLDQIAKIDDIDSLCEKLFNSK